MPMKIEHIHAGLRIKHPSGVVVVTALAQLRKVKESTLRQIAFLQQQVNFIDADIAKVEEKRKLNSTL
jgi:uncharacterized FlgJ-related protein